MELLGCYAYALFRVGNTRRSNLIFEQLAGGRSSSQVFIYDSWKSLADAYSGDHFSAYMLQKAASDIQDDNVKKAFRQSALKAQKDFLREMNIETERLAKRRQFVARGAIILLIVVIILLSLFFKRRSKQSAQEKESLIEAFKELTSQTNEEKAKIRNQYIRMCQSHFSHIGRINEMLHYHSSDSTNTLYQELKASMKRIGSDEQNQREFEELLNDAFDNVMLHFREVFPNKKFRYYQFVSFLFAGFSTVTICTIISSYNKHNVHVEKSRLKQTIQKSTMPYKEQFLELLS